jgi:hypothetical protein
MSQAQPPRDATDLEPISMLRSLRARTFAALVTFAAVPFIGCGNGEQTTKEVIKEDADKVKKFVKEEAVKVKEGMHEAGHKAAELGKVVKEDTGKIMQKAGAAIEKAGDKLVPPEPPK